MNKKEVIGVCIMYALLFVLLFYKKSIGINLIIFEWLAIPAMLYFFRPFKRNVLSITLLLGTIASSLSVIFIHSGWSIFINLVLFLSFAGIITYPGQRSFLHNSIVSIAKTLTAQYILFSGKYWKKREREKTKGKLSGEKLLYWIILPAFIVIIFIFLYSSGSSIFGAKFSTLFAKINTFFSHINFSIFFFFILGLLISNILFLKTPVFALTKQELTASDTLLRKEPKLDNGFLKKASHNKFKIKYRAGIIILGLLNLLILFFNTTDISHIWINYQWDGSFLKEFVHEGTWVLLFSIFLSGGIVLFFFKGQLNFYSKNNALKILTLIWLVQNIIMTVSVLLRNYWYIHYFGLAYKRIAVLFFLGLTMIGLITILIKIYKKKSSYYLIRVNSYTLLLALVLSCFFSWDVLIAKHNFNYAGRSLIDLKFMHRLGDPALPYTYKTPHELNLIEEKQTKALPFSIHQDYLWNKEQYWKEMAKRPGQFMDRYKNRSWLEWNFADYCAYKKLTDLSEKIERP